jgi:hypothetical protein
MVKDKSIQKVEERVGWGRGRVNKLCFLHFADEMSSLISRFGLSERWGNCSVALNEGKI